MQSQTDLERATALSDAAERAQPLSSPAGAKARRASMLPKTSTTSSSSSSSSSSAAVKNAPRHSMPASRTHAPSSTAATATATAKATAALGRKSIGAAKDLVSSSSGASQRANPSTSHPGDSAAASLEQQTGDTSTQSVHQTAQEGQRPNVRLQRLGQALDKFLQLLDHKMTPEAVRKAFPKLDAPVLENARVQFIEELKDVIKAESDTLITQYDLSSRLEELQDLADEAMERDSRGLEPGQEEVKDVWRDDLDIATAVRARAVPVQRERVARLGGMLEELEKENAALQERLRATTTKATEKQRRAKAMLDQLEAASAALETTAEMDERLRSAMDALLDELGPNVSAGLGAAVEGAGIGTGAGGAKRGRE